MILKNIIKPRLSCSYAQNTTITMTEFKINELYIASLIKGVTNQNPKKERYNLKFYDEINPANIWLNVSLSFLKISYDPKLTNKHRNSRT